MQNSLTVSKSCARAQFFGKVVLIFSLLYGFLWGYSRIFVGSVIDAAKIDNQNLHGRAALELSAAFFVFFTPILYGFCCLYARKVIRLKRQIFIYLSATTMGGIFGEIVIGNAAKWLLGSKLWQYTVAPVHDGFTTYMGLVIWPMYGFYLYCFSQALALRGRDISRKFALMGLLIAADAMILETCANSFALVYANRYIFLYSYGDLLHFTSAQIFIPYVICGSLGAALLYFLQNSKIGITTASLSCTLVALFLIVIG